MTKDGAQYSKEVELRANGGRHRDGIYAFRFTTNHSLFESFKANHYKTGEKGEPKLVTGEGANKAQNIIIKIEKDVFIPYLSIPQNLNLIFRRNRLI